MTFNEAVLELIKRYNRNKKVIGIVLTGSAGRGDYDKYSDIDCVVFVKNKNIFLKEGKIPFFEFVLDIRKSCLSHIKKSIWSNDMYYAYLKGNIIYDSKNLIDPLFRKKRREWLNQIKKRLSLSLVNLSVIFSFEDNWKGLCTTTHLEKYKRRKDYLSAQRLITKAFEQSMEIIFLLNKEPFPDDKNKISKIF